MGRFADFVENKTVAIVGPALAPYDQSLEVDSHDVVYRIGFRHDLGKTVPGYGERIDAVFYNAENSRKMILGLYNDFIKDIPYVLLKRDPKVRTSKKYEVLDLPFTKANQIPIALDNLLKWNPKKITVFGADIYLGGHETAYDKNYLDRTRDRDWWGVQIHDPQENHNFLRNLYLDNQEMIVGDERFVEACKLTPDQYWERLKEAWLV